MDVQVLGSGMDDGGGGGGDDSVARLAEKEVVTVPLDPIVVSNCWKLSFKGMVKTPETAIVLPKVSFSRPEISNVAVPVVADVFWKSKGDWAGVHTCPPAAGVEEQPADPSIPGSSIVSAIVMFGAEENVINSGTFRDPGGFVMSMIIPFVPARDTKPPCWELPGEFIENTLPVPKAMPPADKLAVPVIFRTPVMIDALAVHGIIMNAIKLIAAIFLVKIPTSRKLCVEASENGDEDHMRTLLMRHEGANATVQ
jgi:hypothetical protein